jgi:NAD(P)-dependent dehydrogenase (short-subunit alcohol dehydrogenase family)
MTAHDLAQNLAGQTALVTGATSGIGKATAVTLARHGAHVIVVGRDRRRGDAVVDTIRSDGGQAEFVRGDLHDAASATELARRATEVAGGAIDVLVNNAGIGTFGPTEGFDERTFDDIVGTNLKAPFYLVGAIAPAMAERGKGAIINVSTMAGEVAFPGMAVYGASKAALNLLTKSWAAEYGPKGVRVNAVSPGPVRTPAVEFMGDDLDNMATEAPAGYVAKPEEVATTIAFHASDDASFVYGAVLPVDGGRTAV